MHKPSASQAAQSSTNDAASTKRVAVVYDRVNTKFGGAEKVLCAIHDAFPDATLISPVMSLRRAPWATCFHTFQTSWLNSFPFVQRLHRWYVMCMPLAVESLDLSDYDIVISVSSAEAKGVLTKPHQLHVCYLLTPTRYLYTHQAEEVWNRGVLSWPIVSWIAKGILSYLTWWDSAAIARPDHLIPISNLVARRTQLIHERSTEPVLYPPVSSQFFQGQKILTRESYGLIVSRLVPAKRVQAAITAALKLNLPLILVGEGPEEKTIKNLLQNSSFIRLKGHTTLATLTALSRRHNVVWCDHQTDKIIQQLYAHAGVTLVPGQEDFGITSLEAVRAGCPLITHSDSGSSELLQHFPEHQVQFIHQSTPDEIQAAYNRLQAAQKKDPSSPQQNLSHYDITEFVARFRARVLELWELHQRTK